MTELKDEELICPCCKRTGFKGPDFKRITLESSNDSSQSFYGCKRCGVLFSEIDGWNNFN